MSAKHKPTNNPCDSLLHDDGATPPSECFVRMMSSRSEEHWELCECVIEKQASECACEKLWEGTRRDSYGDDDVDGDLDEM